MLHLQHGVGVGASFARDADRRLARLRDKVAIVDVEIRNRPAAVGAIYTAPLPTAETSDRGISFNL
jgi:hypothetical protein